MTDQTATVTPAASPQVPPRERVAVESRSDSAKTTSRFAGDATTESGIAQLDRETGATPDLSFDDFLDIINPLQHIPIVSTIYRQITGDTISAPANVIGSLLFTGPIGMAIAGAGLLIEEATGDSVEGHVMTAMGFDVPRDPSDATAVAAKAEEAPAKVASAEAGLSPALAAQAARTEDAVNAGAQAVPVNLLGSRFQAKTSAVDAAASRQQASAAANPSGTNPNANANAKASAATASAAGQSDANARFFPINRNPEPRAFPLQGRQSNTAARAEARRDELQDKLAPLAALQKGTSSPSTAPAPVASGRASALAADVDQQRKAMAAQGLVLNRDTPSPAAAKAETPAAAPQPAQTSALPASAPAPAASAEAGGPVDMPAWFDSAMQKAIASRASSSYAKSGALNTAP